MTLYIVVDADDGDLAEALSSGAAFTEMDKAVERAQKDREHSSVAIYKTTEIAFYHQRVMSAAAGQPG